MSGLTIELLEGKRPKSRRSRWLEIFSRIADTLQLGHGLPDLGNLSDPVQEIFYILLSSKTADLQYRRTYSRLIERFRDHAAVASARPAEVVECIRSGGIGNLKAERLQRIATTLTSELGRDPSAVLRSMTAQEAYAFLTRLPGIGRKSALCVMMSSLNFDVFPVDVNVSRIAVRLGAVRAGLKHDQYQELIPRLVPDGRSRDLHVGMVVHGRCVCLPRNPKCQACRIRDFCKFGRRQTPT